MSENITSHFREIEGWTIRERKPDSSQVLPVILMLHGWTGDENSMWLFASRLPASAYIIAPRGIYAAPMGGYGWEVKSKAGRASLSDFNLAVERLEDLLTGKNFPQADLQRLHIIGFSQGAAMAFSYSLLHPEGVRTITSLSGFMPGGVESLIQDQPFNGIPVFLAHGTRDEMVPIQQAWIAAGLLERAGASVWACEDDIGHKLSASCFKGLEAFIERYIEL